MTIEELAEKIKADTEATSKHLNMLGDYVDIGFRKIQDDVGAVKKMTSVAGVATVFIAGIGTIVMAYQTGQRSNQGVTMVPAHQTGDIAP